MGFLGGLLGIGILLGIVGCFMAFSAETDIERIKEARAESANAAITQPPTENPDTDSEASAPKVGADTTKSSKPTISTSAKREEAAQQKMVIGLIMLLVGMFLACLSAIPAYIIVYRAWKCLQPGGFARTSPGKAIGFMFIPVFQWYWLFQAVYGLSNDWNRTVETYSSIRNAPRMSTGLFLTFCIGWCCQPLGLIMLFPMLSQACKGINYFVYRPKAGGQGGIFGGPGPGTAAVPEQAPAAQPAQGGLNIGGGFTRR